MAKYNAFIKLGEGHTQIYDAVSDYTLSTKTIRLLLADGRRVIVPIQCTIIEENKR